MTKAACNPLISLTKITKTYAIGNIVTAVLKEVSLQVNAGDMLAIVGTSGSGKSTLMSLIGLLDTFDQGEYLLQGKNITGISDDALSQLRNQHIGFVFQQFHLLPRFSALQNVVLPLSYRHTPPKQAISIDPCNFQAVSNSVWRLRAHWWANPMSF